MHIGHWASSAYTLKTKCMQGNFCKIELIIDNVALAFACVPPEGDCNIG